jgi:hypothetical protein
MAFARHIRELVIHECGRWGSMNTDFEDKYHEGELVSTLAQRGLRVGWNIRSTEETNILCHMFQFIGNVSGATSRDSYMGSVQSAMRANSEASINHAIDTIGLFLNQHMDTLRVELVMEVRKDVGSMILQQRALMDAVLHSATEKSAEEMNAFTKRVVEKMDEVDQINKLTASKAVETEMTTLNNKLELEVVRGNVIAQYEDSHTREGVMQAKMDLIEEAMVKSEEEIAAQADLTAGMQDELEGLKETCDESKELLESQKRSIQKLEVTQTQQLEEARKAADEANRANQEHVNRKIGETLERAHANT